MILRDYQRQAVDRVKAVLDRRPVLVAPTGSGKTVMAVALVQELDLSTLWLAHRKELIDQAAAHLEGLGLWCGRIMADCDPAPLAKVQVASIQTLIRRAMPPAGLIVIDECHHTPAGTYGRVLENYPDAHVVGLTATPFRLDGRGLGDVFGEIVVAAYTDDLCRAGVLHDPKVYAGKSPDLRRVKISMGDYALGELSKRTNTEEQNADIVKTWQEKSAGRRTVAFAVDVAHSQAIVAAFRAAGVVAEHIDGTTSRDEREAILGRLRDARTHVVSNCMVLTEGWDLPALETAILARPTASLNLHLQMIGRIMRACPDKAGAIVLDHAGNHHVHGRVTRRIEYSLDSSKRVGERDPLRLRRCQACQFLFDPSEPCCPECGWIPEPVLERDPLAIHGTGNLVEFDDADFAYRAEFWRLIEGQRMAASYQPGWAAYRFKERFGVWPVVAEGELVDVAHATIEEKRAVYQEFVRQAALKGFKPGWAAYRYRDAFGCWPKGFVEDVRREAMRERVMENASA
jgi:superfamily II DNA or RNA helicase